MVMAVGWTAPAPMPCTSRKTISDGIDHANPHKNRAKEEDRDPDQHHSLAADEIGELAEHHGGRGLRQKERREHPAVERQAAELADDLRHGGGDDRRFDRDHEIRRHDGGEHKRTVSRQGESSVILGRLPVTLTEKPSFRQIAFA